MKQAIAILVFLIPSASGHAGDLLEVYEAAKQNDPRLQAASSAYEALRESVPQARAALLPGLVLDARVGDVRERIGEQAPSLFGPRDEVQDFRTKSYTVQATQPLFRYPDWVALRQAHASIRQGFALYAAQEQDLILRTAVAYISVQSSQDSLDFARAEQAAVGRQLEVVTARRRGGLANVTDEQEAQARYSRVEADVISAEFVLDDAYDGLMEIVGTRATDLDPLRSNFPVVAPAPADVSAWLDQATRNNLLLIAANEAVVLADEEVKRRRSVRYPSVDLIVRHGNVDSDQDLTAVSGGVNDVDTTEVSVQMTVPLYSGGAIRSQTRQALKQHEQAVHERERQRRLVSRETRATYQAIVTAISRVKALRDSVRAQEGVLEGKTKGLASGVNTLFEVLEAESDLYSTKRDLANAGYDYLLNMLKLKQQVGSLAEEDLADIDALTDSRSSEEGAE